MRRMLLGVLAGLSCLALLASATPAKALVAAPAPIQDRVAQAQVIIVGKVTAIEQKPISARPAPGGQPVEYQVAVVQVGEALVGAKGLTHVRVGFIPPQAVAPPDPTNPIRIPIRRYPSVNLTKDQEVCLFLTPHASESFFVAPMYYDVIDKKSNPNFDKEVALVRRCTKVLADPNAGLKSKDGEDRLLAASMLLGRYRTLRGPVKGVPKQEPIDAEQSKLILLALAEADWTARATAPMQATPQSLFYRLGLKPQDGWVQPKVAKEFPEAAKKWLRENADKYRIQRYVSEAS